MKHSDKPLLKETMRKLQFLPRIEPLPQRWESTTLTTAPIPVTYVFSLFAVCLYKRYEYNLWDTATLKTIIKALNSIIYTVFDILLTSVEGSSHLLASATSDIALVHCWTSWMSGPHSIAITAENNAEIHFYLVHSCSLLCYQKLLLLAKSFTTRK